MNFNVRKFIIIKSGPLMGDWTVHEKKQHNSAERALQRMRFPK
jgi:hypothetical protein